MADGALDYALRLSGGSAFLGTLNSAGSGVASLTTRVVGLAAPLAGMAAGVGAIGVAMKSLSAAADMESIVVSMGVLTGGTEKATALLDDLRKMGAATPYEFPALATGAQTMLQFGIETKEILPLVKMLGDISGGSADKLSSLTLVLGQVSSAGRMTGGDLLQFINAGFNPLVQISEKTGESMVDLRKRMEEGGISFAEVRGAMESATSAGGLFYGMMEKMSGTTTGLVSTLKDEINGVFLAFGQPVNDAIKPILTDAIAKVSELKPLISSIGESAATGISRVYAAASSGQLGALLEAELMVIGAKFANTVGTGLNTALNTLAPIGNALGDAMVGAGQMLKGSLIDAAGAFSIRFAEALAAPQTKMLEAMGLDQAAASLKGIVADLADSGMQSEGKGEITAGKGVIGTAFDALVRGAAGGQVVGKDKITELESDRDETRIRLDRQTRAEALARKKATEEADTLAKAEAECTEAAKNYDNSLVAAAKAVTEEAAPTASPMPGALSQVTASGELGEKERGAVRNVADSRRSRFDRLSKVDKARFGGDFSAFEMNDKGGLKNSLSNGSRLDIAAEMAKKAIGGKALADGSRLASGAGATLNPNARALGDSNRAAKEKPDSTRDLAALLQKIEQNTAAFADIAVA